MGIKSSCAKFLSAASRNCANSASGVLAVRRNRSNVRRSSATIQLGRNGCSPPDASKGAWLVQGRRDDYRRVDVDVSKFNHSSIRSARVSANIRSISFGVTPVGLNPAMSSIPFDGREAGITRKAKVRSRIGTIFRDFGLAILDDDLLAFLRRTNICAQVRLQFGDADLRLHALIMTTSGHLVQRAAGGSGKHIGSQDARVHPAGHRGTRAATA